MLVKQIAKEQDKVQEMLRDSVVNLPYFDIKFAPPPYNRHPIFTCADPVDAGAPSFTPRVYVVALGIEIDRVPLAGPGVSSGASVVWSPETTSSRLSQRCIVVAYRFLILLDRLSSNYASPAHANVSPSEAGIVRLISLSDEGSLVGVALSEEDPSWFGILRDPSQPDVLIQLPVHFDGAVFMKSLSAVFHHHQGRDLPVTVVDSTEELIHKIHFGNNKNKNSESTQETSVTQDIPCSQIVSKQLWSMTNLCVPFVLDRMTFVKETFSSAEKETKEALAEMERSMQSASMRIDLRAQQVKEKFEELERQTYAQNEKEFGLQEQQKILFDTIEQGREMAGKKEHLKVSFMEELQQWREVLQQRMTEELKKRQRLAHFQQRRTKCVESESAEIESIEASIHDGSEKLQAYESELYVGLLKKRDEGSEALKVLTKELCSLKKTTCLYAGDDQSRSPSYRSRSNASSAAASTSKTESEILSANGVLRQMIMNLRESLAAEEINQEHLADDLAGFQAECGRMQEEILLFEFKTNQAQQGLKKQLESVASAEAMLSNQRQQIDGLKSLPRYYVEKQRMQSAAVRRATLEHDIEKSKSAQQSVCTDLKQKVFSEKLRMFRMVRNNHQEQQ